MIILHKYSIMISITNKEKNMATILIVEDNESMRELMVAKLERYFSVITAKDGLEGLKAMEQSHIDLVIADIMMPRMDGYEFIRALRTMNDDTPIILSTAKQSFADKKDGFAVGADDYMTKPFNFEELLWRINALLKRAKIAADKEIKIGDFLINATNFEVFYHQVPIELTRKEFELIYKLLSYPGKLFSKDKLMMDIWGYESISDDTTIRTHINRLRNKFNEIKEFDIITIKGLGYKAVIKK